MEDFPKIANKCFALRLKELREACTLTQEQLADKLQVSRGSISFYEREERIPDIQFLVRVADYFDVSVSFLLGESDNRKSNNISIGDRLNLTDEAIDYFERNEDLGSLLSELIGQDQFLEFCSFCFGYLNEDSFRHYSNWSIDGICQYIVNANELEEYRGFKIAQLFVKMLQRIKIKRKYHITSQEDVARVLDEASETLNSYFSRYKEQFVPSTDEELIKEYGWTEADFKRRKRFSAVQAAVEKYQNADILSQRLKQEDTAPGAANTGGG